MHVFKICCFLWLSVVFTPFYFVVCSLCVLSSFSLFVSTVNHFCLFQCFIHKVCLLATVVEQIQNKSYLRHCRVMAVTWMEIPPVTSSTSLLSAVLTPHLHPELLSVILQSVHRLSFSSVVLDVWMFAC